MAYGMFNIDFSLLQIILCGGASRRIQYRQNSQKTASQQESEDHFEENYRIKKIFRSSIGFAKTDLLDLSSMLYPIRNQETHFTLNEYLLDP